MTKYDDAHSDVNRAIDAVAARMTAVEPSANLRVRVLTRLDERPARRWVWTLAPAAATVAVVAVATTLVVRRPARVAPETPAITSAPSAAPAASGALEPAANVVSVAVSRGSARSSATTTAASWNDQVLPALSKPALLSVGSIQPDALGIAQLSVEPLVAEAPLTVPPIDGARGGR